MTVKVEASVELQNEFRDITEKFLEAKAEAAAAKARLGKEQGKLVAFLLEHGDGNPDKPDTDDRTIKSAGYRVQWCARGKVDDDTIIKWAESHRIKTIRGIVVKKPTLDKTKFKALCSLGKVPKTVLADAQGYTYSMLARTVEEQE